ncbi:MAG: hypothetical protein II949_03980 [Prevotella sp.]|nr:hypothetical protein [Prevotella sp.]
MKKAMLILAAVAVATTASAKILRVSNVTGSSAPYTTIEAAQEAASSGDTIMVDASSTLYTKYSDTNIDLTKRLVIIGPGYWLVKDGIMQEGASTAEVGKFTIKAEGTVIKGMTINYINIQASKAVINRCHLGNVAIEKAASNVVLSQNFITGRPNANGGSFHQVTNNIFSYDTNGSYNMLSSFDQSYVAYNTFRASVTVFSLTNSTIEHNIWSTFNDKGSGNSATDNYVTAVVNTQSTDNFIDSDYYSNIELPADVTSKYGAFAGDSPYVLAGVPSGPVIQDLVVPTTVEMGSKMNVTIKIGMQK